MAQPQRKTAAAGNLKVVTGKVRASYVKVFRPEKNDDGKDTYSMTILVPKSDTVTVGKIFDAIAAAKMKKWGDPDEDVKITFRDGDKPKSEGGKGGQGEYKGHYFMGVKSFEPVGIIDRNKQDIISPLDFVSGDYCRVSIGAFAYANNGNNGVTFFLNNIQVLGKGEPLGGRGRAEDDFADDFADDENVEDLF